MNRQEAIDIVKKNWPDSSFTSLKEALEFLIPELMNTDDEKIKEAIIKGITHAAEEGCFCSDNYSVKECVAWLEKQGESKPIGKLQLSEELYEHIRNTCACIDDALSSETLADINDYLSTAEHSAKSAFDMIEKQGEQKPVYPLAHKKMEHERWKEACEAACYDGNCRSHYGLTETRDDYFVDGVQWADEHPKQKPAWSEEDENMLKTVIIACDTTHESETNRIFHDTQVAWLKSLKDRIQPQNRLKESLATADLENSLCDIQDVFSDTSYEYRILGEAIEFIRCTEPKPQWKPSDEQMKALKSMINIVDRATSFDARLFRIVESFYEQLKTL